MQSVSSRIWTRIAMFISYDNNHYTTNTLYIIRFLIKLYYSITTIRKGYNFYYNIQGFSNNMPKMYFENYNYEIKEKWLKNTLLLFL